MLRARTLSDCDFVVVDLETTGCMPGRNSVIEIGAVRIHAGRVVSSFSSLVRPHDVVPRAVVQLTGITNEMLETAPDIDQVIVSFRTFADDAVLVAHNYRFDLGFLDFEAEQAWGEPFPRPVLDTLSMARRVFPGLERYSVGGLAAQLGTPTLPDHRASNDATATAEVLLKMLPFLDELGVLSVSEAATFCGLPGQVELAARLPLAMALPDEPGLYVFRDGVGAVLYIGRGKSIRSAVRGHFYPSSDRLHSDLGSRVMDVWPIPVHSTLDAALLERRFLARYQPPYNPAVRRRHDAYLLHLDVGSAFPSVKVVTQKRRTGVHAGPLTSRWAAAHLADRLSAAYGLRMCRHRLTAAIATCECEYRDGECCSPCSSEVDPAIYATAVRRLLAVFEGASDDARDILTERQLSAAADCRYEEAIRYRDGLRALDRGTGTLRALRIAAATDAVVVEISGQRVSAHLVRSGLRATVLRGTAEHVAERMPSALRRVYFSERPRIDLLDLTRDQIAEMMIIAAFLEGDAHRLVPIGEERLTVAAVKRSLGLIRREPRRHHAAL